MEAPVERERHLVAVDDEAPRERRAADEKAQDVVLAEIDRRARAAAPGQIARSTDDDEAGRADLLVNELALAELGHPHDHVDPLGDGIDDVVAKREVDRELRIHLQETRHRRAERVATESRRRVYAEAAAGGGACVRERGVRVFEVAENLRAALVVSRAVRSEAEAAGRPIEEADAEARFEAGDDAARVDTVLDAAVKDKRIVGAVVRVVRDGEVVAHRAVGLADRESGAPMSESTHFRLASLTKPIVAVATLDLVSRGVLDLESDVTQWLPEFRPTFDGRPARITLRHLLTHTSGLGYAFLEAPDGPYHRANVSDGLDQPGLSAGENLRRLGSLPLHFAPGSAFLYSLSFDVLGEVLARATGTTLPDLVARAITRPLGMTETSFSVRDPSHLATPYADGKPEPTRMVDGIFVPFAGAGAHFAPTRALDPHSYPSGGAGMVGTVDDFFKFLEAVRTRDAFASSTWLDAMTSDQIAPITSPILGDGWGYGYGVGYLRDPKAAASPLSAGSVRWGGAYGHCWFLDPATRTSSVLLTNTAFEGMTGQIRTDLENAVCGR